MHSKHRREKEKSYGVFKNISIDHSIATVVWVKKELKTRVSYIGAHEICSG